MKHLRITAFLTQGFSAAYEWALSIDGIVGYAKKMNELGFDDFVYSQSSNNMKPLDDLPFQKEHFLDMWWYKCSMPIFKIESTQDKHLFRRFNTFEAETMLQNVKKVETTKGAYRNAMISKTFFITKKVDWFVIGDKEEIEKYLKMITHIGGARRAGFGAVSKWEVVEVEENSKPRLYRPLPIEFAERNNVTGLYVNWAIRPPATISVNKFDCVIPRND
ncbi:hypothetical protein FcAc13_05040 [Frischella sp. Ac13]|uniref:Uncharacterized protein n=1 Tax=Frischella japonica TaxID=2741544 RepID=A0ABR7QWR6_9GAMM|nr:hypothetical protein [Frischella japonica]MBC9130672.1 hypothetical protein [Frischella japonica]